MGHVASALWRFPYAQRVRRCGARFSLSPVMSLRSSIFLFVKGCPEGRLRRSQGRFSRSSSSTRNPKKIPLGFSLAMEIGL